MMKLLIVFLSICGWCRTVVKGSLFWHSILNHRHRLFCWLWESQLSIISLWTKQYLLSTCHEDIDIKMLLRLNSRAWSCNQFYHVASTANTNIIDDMNRIYLFTASEWNFKYLMRLSGSRALVVSILLAKNISMNPRELCQKFQIRRTQHPRSESKHEISLSHSSERR